MPAILAVGAGESLLNSSFSTSGLQRHLHSFPTRRSSDLRLGGYVFERLGSQVVAAQVVIEHDFGRGARSEEHTSELQSRENLVCRLLLEKKKNTGYRFASCSCTTMISFESVFGQCRRPPT